MRRRLVAASIAVAMVVAIAGMAVAALDWGVKRDAILASSGSLTA